MLHHRIPWTISLSLLHRWLSIYCWAFTKPFWCWNVCHCLRLRIRHFLWNRLVIYCLGESMLSISKSPLVSPVSTSGSYLFTFSSSFMSLFLSSGCRCWSRSKSSTFPRNGSRCKFSMAVSLFRDRSYIQSLSSRLLTNFSLMPNSPCLTGSILSSQSLHPFYWRRSLGEPSSSSEFSLSSQSSGLSSSYLKLLESLSKLSERVTKEI